MTHLTLNNAGAEGTSWSITSHVAEVCWGMLRYAEVLQVLPFTGCFVTVGYVKLHLQLLRIVCIHSCVLVLVPSLDLIGQDSMLPLDGSLKLGHHLPLVSHGFPLIRHGGWKSPVFFHGLMSGKSTESTCSSARQQHSATLQVQRLVQRAWQTGHGEYRAAVVSDL